MTVSECGVCLCTVSAAYILFLCPLQNCNLYTHFCYTTANRGVCVHSKPPFHTKHNNLHKIYAIHSDTHQTTCSGLEHSVCQRDQLLHVHNVVQLVCGDRPLLLVGRGSWSTVASP